MHRRFEIIRNRLLLWKQDEVARLEETLTEVDQAETTFIFLGSLRDDHNGARKQIMEKLDTALADYG